MERWRELTGEWTHSHLPQSFGAQSLEAKFNFGFSSSNSSLHLQIFNLQIFAPSNRHSFGFLDSPGARFSIDNAKSYVLLGRGEEAGLLDTSSLNATAPKETRGSTSIPLRPRSFSLMSKTCHFFRSGCLRRYYAHFCHARHLRRQLHSSHIHPMTTARILHDYRNVRPPSSYPSQVCIQGVV